MTTYTCKVLAITTAEPNSSDDDTTEVDALLLPDGRVLVVGAGVDGGDSLFASIEAYEPNGTAIVESVVETVWVREIDVSWLASGDVDNVRYDAKSLLTPAEQIEVRSSDDRCCERWVETGERI